MVSLRSQDGKIIIQDGKVGASQQCCCDDCCTCANTQQVLGTLRFDFAGLAEDGRTGGDGGTPIPEGGFDFFTPPQFGSAGNYWIAGDVVDGTFYQYFRVLWDGAIDPNDCTFTVSVEVSCVNRECIDTYEDCILQRDENNACVCTNHPEINDCVDQAECLYVCTQVATYTWTYKLGCNGDQLEVHDVGEPTVTVMFPDGFPTCDVDCNTPPKPQFTVTSTGSLSCRCCDEGACCYSVPACVRSFCADTVMQNGYWIQQSPPGGPNNPSSDLFLCEYIPDPTAFPSDGCEVYYNTTVVKPDGYCGGAPVGFANEYSCVTNLVGGVRYCDDNVSQSYCDEKNGFFFLGKTCQDMEEVNGQPGCGIEGPYIDGF